MTVFGVELQSLRRPTAVEVGEHLSAVVAVATLGVVLASDAGRTTAVMVWVLVACLPALLFTRPWRQVPAWLLYLLAALPTTAVAVSYLTPTGFAYSRDLCVWSYAAVLSVAVLSYARTPGRRAAILLFVCMLGFYDFFEGFVPWRFHGDPGRAMVGTFYQPDMFGAFCAGAALTAAALAVLAPSPWRWVGWAAAPPCAAGCVLSTSRAGEALLVLGVVALGVVATSGPDRWRRLAAWGGVIALSVGLLFLITGPLVFPDAGGSPLAGTTRRVGNDSLGTSSSVRQAYWVAALREFRHAPAVGEGFGAYGLTFFDRAPVGAFGSRYAHNGFLQGLGEGGLLFGVPLLALGAAAGVAGLRSLAQPRRGAGWGPVARASAGLGALALLAHTLVDFDWSFPLLAGLLAVLVSASAGERAAASSFRIRTILPVVLLGGATVFCAYAVHDGLKANKDIASAQRLASSGRTSEAVEVLRRADHALVPNPLIWSEMLSLAAAKDDGSGVVPQELREKALQRTSAMAALDPHLQLLRATVLLRSGRVADALALGRRVMQTSSRTRPDLIGDYGLLLSEAGQSAAAVQLLSSSVRERASAGFPLPDNVWSMVGALQTIAGADSPPARCAFEQALGAFGDATRPAFIPVPQATGATGCS